MAYYSHIVEEYTNIFKDTVVSDCNCYKTYSKISEIDSFLACVVMNGKVFHRKLPIMIGSNLVVTSIKFPTEWNGCFLINTKLVVIQPFMSNNTQTLHSFKNKTTNEVRLKINSCMYKYIVKGDVYEKQETTTGSLLDKHCECDIPEDLLLAIMRQAKPHLPSLDDIRSKLVITPAVLLQRALQVAFTSESNKWNLLINGNLFFLLSKHNIIRTQQVSSSVYVPVNDEKVETPWRLHTIIRRAVHARGKSVVLAYQPSFYKYFCPLTTKDMVGAGEHLSFAKYAYVSGYDSTVSEYVLSKRISPNDLNSHTMNALQVFGITHKCNTTEEIKMCTSWNVPSNTQWTIFILSEHIVASYVSVDALRLQFPELRINTFNISYGELTIPVAVIINGGIICRLTSRGITNKITNDTSKPLKRKHCSVDAQWLDDEDNVTLPAKRTVSINNARNQAMSKEFYSTWNVSNQQSGYIVQVDGVFEKTCLVDYTDPIFAKYVNKQTLSNICINTVSLWTGFGDISGFTNEDGIVLDKNIPITYTFSWNVMVVANSSFNHISCNVRIGDRVIIAVLTSSTPLKLKHTAHVHVASAETPSISIYHVSITYHSDLVVTQSVMDKKLWIHTTRNSALGIGSKICNQYGQKGVVGYVTDLSNHNAIVNNEAVHLQVLYSDVSLIGRTTGGQFKHMLKYGVTTNTGILMALQKFVISRMHSETKANLIQSKVDLMTRENAIMPLGLESVVNSLGSNEADIFDVALQTAGFCKL